MVWCPQCNDDVEADDTGSVSCCTVVRGRGRAWARGGTYACGGRGDCKQPTQAHRRHVACARFRRVVALSPSVPQCGRVLDENAFSSDIMFTKGADGDGELVGQFIGEGGEPRGLARFSGGRMWVGGVSRRKGGRVHLPCTHACMCC